MAPQFIILHGEMRDVDYLDVFGPFATREDAQAEADRLVSIGAILIEPDDQLDYRIMALNDSSQAKPHQEHQDEQDVEEEDADPVDEADVERYAARPFSFPGGVPAEDAGHVNFTDLLAGSPLQAKVEEAAMMDGMKMLAEMLELHQGDVSEDRLREIFGQPARDFTEDLDGHHQP